MEKRADRRKYHYIYKITRHDGKFYIGMHSTDNLEDNYWGSGRYLKRSIDKHGKELHIKVILEYCESRIKLREREKEIVTDDLLNDPLCMNLAPGGNMSGYQYAHSEETKRKVSEFHKGRKRSEKTKEKMRKAQKQVVKKPLTKNHKKNIGKALKGRIKTDTEKTNLSISLRGRKLSVEHRANISKVQKGKKRGPRKDQEAHIARIKLARSKRCTVDGIMIYSSRAELVKALGNGNAGSRSPCFKYLTE